MLSRSERFLVTSALAGQPGCAIVADADEAAYTTVRQLAAPDRWKVKSALTADELRAQLHEGPVQLVLVNQAILDASPEMAEELIERSRRGTNIVVTVDEHNETNERKARLMSPIFYAPKPLNFALLGRALERVLEPAV